MTFNLFYATLTGAQTQLFIETGETIFVLGANGTGKSSLMHRFYVQNHGTARQISAHRQTWFSSGAVTLSPQQKRQTETNIKASDTNAQARWMDQHSANRASIAIYDLIDAENVRAREIASAVDMQQLDMATLLSRKDAPIKLINELLQQSNIPIAIAVKENDQVIASKNGGQPYSIAELSDGERNALLIAANILTAPPGSLMLVDEPERHLHRSIISPLLTLLFAKRPDCAFVVSTHDVMMPLDNPTARVLLVRGCVYSGSTVTGWDADLVTFATGLDDELKEDILGSRRNVIFVEGKDNSLDKPLYSLIFPNTSIIAKSSCHEVERAVVGIRDASEFHWVSPWGVVDNDRRPAQDIEELQRKGVFALPVFAVESIYYHPTIQLMVADRQVAVTGGDSAEGVNSAKKAALAAVSPHVIRLCERTVEKKLRDEMFKQLPRKKQISSLGPLNFTIDVPAFFEDERQRLQRAIDEQDLETVIGMYPVRETPALNEIASKLGFQGRQQYENAVRKLIMSDPQALQFVRSLFGPLLELMNSPKLDRRDQ